MESSHSFVSIQSIIDNGFAVYDFDSDRIVSSWKHEEDAETARLEYLAECLPEVPETAVVDMMEAMF